MKNIFFRFFFIFSVLMISPWNLLSSIPGISYLIEAFNKIEVWVVEFFNKFFLHVKIELNQNGGGSGDTSYAWAQLFSFLIVAILGSFIWAIKDRKRNYSYRSLIWGFNNFIRYYLSSVAFSYGIIKLFAQQMPFPSLSQLATPLGDFLPMRFSWMFFGYSTPYQMFSGIIEIIVAVLLLNRKTVTLGSLLGVGVFTNVFMLNLSYDIPVKLYSMLLLIFSVYLATNDWRRLYNVFFKNSTTLPFNDYDFIFHKKWQRITRIILKVLFVAFTVLIPIYESWSYYENNNGKPSLSPIKVGQYKVQLLVKNNDTLNNLTDDIDWKDFIFDVNGSGSINSLDTLFRLRYGRSYFFYDTDTKTQSIVFRKFSSDSIALFKMNYKIIDTLTLELKGKVKSDSVIYLLKRKNKNYPLTERPFHWISESNR